MANILIVDDALFMRKMLSDILIKGGHRIVGEAGNAMEAVNLSKELKPDLITMDIIMPEIDDMTSLKAIKEIKSNAEHVKIVMVSAMGQQEIVTESILAGANDFIIKPFQASLIIATVAKLMDN